MHIDSIRTYCLAKKGVTEEFPFDPDTLVFKVLGRIFLLTSLKKWEEGDQSVNLKCDPEWSEELRAQYSSIYGGYHMNKKHWNTVVVNQSELSDSFIKQLIDHSYEMVVSGFTKKQKEALRSI